MSLRRWILVLLLCGVVHSSAQEAAAPSAPEPDRLAADWWTYFAPSEALSQVDLETRIQLTIDRVQQEIEASSAEGQERLAAQADRLQSSLSAYAALVAMDSVEAKGAVSPAASYTVDHALERFKAWRQRDLQLRAIREEVEWQRPVIEQSRRQQSQQRAAYLDLRSDDANRFSLGLSLMVSRAQLEESALRLARQQVAVQLGEAELKQLQDELDLIPNRLQPQASSLEAWQLREVEARAALVAWQRENAVAPTKSPPAAEVDSATLARQAVLDGIEKELNIALAESDIKRAELAQLLIEPPHLQNGEEEIPDWDAVGVALQNYQDWASATNLLIVRAARSTSRIRTIISDQLAAMDSANPSRQLLESTLALADTMDQEQRRLEVELSSNNFLSGLLETLREGGLGTWERATSQTKNVAETIWGAIANTFRYTLFEINETPVNGLGILRIVLILFIAVWASRFLRRGLERFGGSQKRVSKTSLYMVQRIIHYVIIAMGILIGLTSIGLDLTKFALFASALGVGLGFGLQNLVSNFVAGLIILFERSLNVGDFVELESGLTGEVNEINMRSTLITTNDNIDILVPNSEFVSTRVTNWTLREAFRRIHVPFGVAYGTDKDLVKKAVLEAADRVPWGLDHPRRKPVVWLVGFGDSSLDFELVVWLTPEAVKRPAAVQSDFLWEIETSLKKHGIEIPFPQRDLHLRSGFEKKLEGGD